MIRTWIRRTATCWIRTMTESRRTLGRRVLVLLLWAVILPAALWAEHVPEAPDGVVELENHLRLFYDLGDFDPMAAVSWRFEDEEFEFRYRSITLGSYYRVLDNLKVGAFYRLQAGARHDDDWVEEPQGEWWWEQSTDRYESLFIGDVSPRFLLEFLPGRDWVFMLKNRYIYNSYNGEQVGLVRPSLTYFHLVDREPRFNVSLAYGAYFSLNFGETLLYKRAPYLNFLYHLSPTLLLDASVARETTTWGTSEDVERSGESGYTEDYSRWVLSIGAILRFQ